MRISDWSSDVCSSDLAAGIEQISVLDVDHVTIGSYIRNTMVAGKNQSREQSLFEIYRVMRPGEPPTMDTAEALFHGLFFDSERYDLSAVGRVKLNASRNLEAEDTVRVLRTEDILACVRTLIELGRAHVRTPVSNAL